ncbi:MAG: ATP-grasp domain-containing protein [Oscillospiraceae bacterium]|nr:ATP-grasp domain-containing protein [Oscillospiraceae bacterium]
MTEKQGWLVYHPIDIPRNQWFIAELMKNAQLHGISMKLLSSQEIPPAECPALLVNRSRDASWSRRCSLHGARVMNSTAVTEITNNKFSTFQFLHGEHGIPMAETVLYTAEDAEIPSIPMPFVAKPLDGHGGEGVAWIEDPEQFETYKKTHQLPFLLQEPMATGWDVRVYVLGGEIYKAVLRTSDRDFRSNFSLGGDVSLYTPDVPMRELVRKVNQVLPLDFAGVDFLRHPNGGYVVGEIEDAVGCRMLYSLTDCDPAADFMRLAANSI